MNDQLTSMFVKYGKTIIEIDRLQKQADEIRTKIENLASGSPLEICVCQAKAKAITDWSTIKDGDVISFVGYADSEASFVFTLNRYYTVSDSRGTKFVYDDDGDKMMLGSHMYCFAKPI